MKRLMFGIATAAMLLMTTAAQAHAGHHHKTVMGTVRAIDASHIDVTTTDGKEVSVPLLKSTTFVRGGETATAADIKAGTRVVILLGEDDKSAQQVKIGVATKKKEQ